MVPAKAWDNRVPQSSSASQPSSSSMAADHPSLPIRSQDQLAPDTNYPDIAFEFSNRKWRSTAAYLQTELLSSMRLVISADQLSASPRVAQKCCVRLVQLEEQETGYDPIFRVWSNQPSNPDRLELIWDYHTEGGFPTARALRRRVQWSSMQ
ncbi:uncharacterized protein UMAG_11032 [Mycosarcoma maydis]|uniref:Uncharacterized protein n=1 Tax=Mycosarcoma maydis TaxID=5270 RepID=A0A0D1BVW3_MYCMD|nr:uncharacterized protein UMAG_11031 [Ustilago maydis 521]XP_011392320.1 uncharacterized protein UMAG_11032 [Ustilago maydis 521]KIS66142.1 hypothetical protein UMAG_11031 [Ustilago maydis 521]KIS66143.1 hypothetical protein UMAG_11032 [Ustilago maydis 521]|eukprot:XP_011392319.1 hypothetical protein UMAG_11031 [Ustilago maydis 521]